MDRVGICRPIGELGRIRRRGVYDVRAKRVQVGDKGRIRSAIQRDGFLHAVVADAESAADDQAIVHVLMQQRQTAWIPCEANLGSPVVVAGVVQIAADFQTQAQQRIRLWTEDRVADIPEFFVYWSKIFPAQAEVQGERRLDLEIVLREKCVDIGANVLSRVGGLPGQRIEVSALLLRCIVEEIPDIVESLRRQRHTGDFATWTFTSK